MAGVFYSYIMVFSIDTSKAIDLTMPLEHGQKGVDVAVARTIGEHGWNASTYTLYSHTGTHMDAQIHFNAGTGTIDTFPIERLLCKCHVVRCPDLAPSAFLTCAHLGEVVNTLQPGEGLLFHTDWSKHAGTSMYRDELPRISAELAQWCVDKQVNLLGVEPPSVADVNDLPEVTHIHEILLSANVIIVEGLHNLDKIPGTQALVMALPLKMKGGDGAPARVIAFPLN